MFLTQNEVKMYEKTIKDFQSSNLYGNTKKVFTDEEDERILDYVSAILKLDDNANECSDRF